MVENMFEKLAAAASCPLATRNLKINTINRNKAIKADHIQYGPINLSDKSYWVRLAKHWKTTIQAATKSKCGNCAAFDVSPRMQECMPGMVQEDGVLGYCHMHHFKCHSERSCYTWAAGGPIKSDKVSTSWHKKEKKASRPADMKAHLRQALDKHRSGQPLGATEKARLKARGLIPRSDGSTRKGKLGKS